MPEKEKPRDYEYDVYMNGGQSRSISGISTNKAVKKELFKQKGLISKWRRLRYVWQSEGFYAMLDALAGMKEEK